MPLAAADFGVDAVDLMPATFDDTIKTNIVFERVGPDNVVVVSIENTDSNTSRTINLAGDGFEFQGASTFLAAKESRIASGKR